MESIAQKKYRQSEKGAEYHKNYSREWARKKYTKEKGKRDNLRANYGITIEDYERMFSEQDGKCAICGNELDTRSERGCGANVDHDHETGKIRSLLCRACNLMIGYALDNTGTLLSAITYLQKWSTA